MTDSSLINNKAKFWKDPKRHWQNAQRKWTSYPCCQDKWANSETISIKFVPIVAKIVRKSVCVCGVRGETKGSDCSWFWGGLVHRFNDHMFLYLHTCFPVKSNLLFLGMVTRPVSRGSVTELINWFYSTWFMGMQLWNHWLKSHVWLLSFFKS